MEPNQQKLDPRTPKDAVQILNIATETLAGPNAGSRGYAVSVQLALETLAAAAEKLTKLEALFAELDPATQAKL